MLVRNSHTEGRYSMADKWISPKRPDKTDVS